MNIVGKGATKKVRVRWTNLKYPEELEYRFLHSIFIDPTCANKNISAKNL